MPEVEPLFGCPPFEELLDPAVIKQRFEAKKALAIAGLEEAIAYLRLPTEELSIAELRRIRALSNKCHALSQIPDEIMLYRENTDPYVVAYKKFRPELLEWMKTQRSSYGHEVSYLYGYVNPFTKEFHLCGSNFSDEMDRWVEANILQPPEVTEPTIDETKETYQHLITAKSDGTRLHSTQRCTTRRIKDGWRYVHLGMERWHGI